MFLKKFSTFWHILMKKVDFAPIYNRKSYCYITGEPLFQKFQTWYKSNFLNFDFFLVAVENFDILITSSFNETEVLLRSDKEKNSKSELTSCPLLYIIHLE